MIASAAKKVYIPHFFYLFLIQYIISYHWLQELDGQNIYNGCCTLRIDYSKLSNLTVKYNNEKTRSLSHYMYIQRGNTCVYIFQLLNI